MKKKNNYNPVKSSIKHVGEFYGFFPNGDIEILDKDKRKRFLFMNEGVAKEFVDLKMSFRDEVQFLATKRNKIITHYLRHSPTKQTSLI